MRALGYHFWHQTRRAARVHGADTRLPLSHRTGNVYAGSCHLVELVVNAFDAAGEDRRRRGGKGSRASRSPLSRTARSR